MRQEMARLSDHVEGHCAIRYSPVYVEFENAIRASQQLHVFNELLVTLALGDVLVALVRERMRPDRRDLESCFARQLSQLAAQMNDVRACVLDRIANLRPKLDD